jgi:hypothetical protein
VSDPCQSGVRHFSERPPAWARDPWPEPDLTKDAPFLLGDTNEADQLISNEEPDYSWMAADEWKVPRRWGHKQQGPRAQPIEDC